MLALKICVLPPVSTLDMAGGLRVRVVAATLRVVVAQTEVETEAHPCTVTT